MNSLNKNIFYLLLIQIIRYILPIITFPYLTRTLGVDGFGYLGLATALVTYIRLVSQYGFDISGTARIAKVAYNKKSISIYYSSVLCIRFILLLFSILLSTIYLFFKDDSVLSIIFLCVLPMALFDIFIPVWLFQGLEKIKDLTLIMLLSRLFTVPFVFLLVKGEMDLYLAGFIQSSSFILSAILCSTYLYYYKLVKFAKVRRLHIVCVFKKSLDIFITTLSASVYSSMIVIIIGFLGTITDVGYFTIAQKIRDISLQFFNPIYQSIFPRINNIVKSQSANARYIVNKYLKICMLLCLSGCLFLYLNGEFVIKLLAGNAYVNALPILNIIILSIFLSVLNNFFGIQTMIPSGYDKLLRIAVMYSSLFCFLLSIPIIYLYGSFGAAFVVSLAELILFIVLVYFHKKTKLNFIFGH